MDNFQKLKMIKMKQNKMKYFRLLLIAGLLFALQSCLKNNKYYIDFSKGAPAVELPLAANNANSPVAVSFDVSTTPTQYYVAVNLASVNKLNTPVTATLAIDSAYLTSYNAQQDAATKKAQADYLAADPNNKVTDSKYPPDYVPFELMPDSTYSVKSFNATIAPGHRLDSVPIQLFTNKIDAGHIYVLPFTIQKASISISSWNHLLLNVGAKNKYDGIYNMTISTTGWGAYGIADGGTNDWGKIGVVTAGVSSVVFDIGYQPAFTASGAGTGFGATDPEFTFDANTNNLVSVTNLAAPDARNRQFQINPAATVNNWDPATKTMNLSYIMTQNGRPPQYINEVLTYVGPR